MLRFGLTVALTAALVSCGDASNSGQALRGQLACRTEPAPRIVRGASGTTVPQPTQPLAAGADSVFFQQIRGAFLRPDGFTVVDPRGRQVFFFDNTGRLEAIVGRDGDGPGEFRSLLPSVLEDTLWILDTRLRRWTVITNDARIQRSFPAEVQKEGSQILSPVGPFPDGTVLFAQSSGSSSRGPETYRSTVTLERFALDGEFLGELGPFPSTERFIDATVVFEVHGRPFGKVGSFVRLGSDVLVATGDSALLHLYGTDGAQVRTIAVQDHSFTISDEIAQAFREEMLAEQSWTERALENVEIPSRAPPYAAVLASRDNQIWVADYPLPGDTIQRYVSYTITGQPTEELELPIQLSISDSDQSRVLAIHTDSFGSQSVALFDRQCTG